MVTLVDAFMNNLAGTDSHDHTAERERRIREAALDETEGARTRRDLLP
jgi:hypothetical protein